MRRISIVGSAATALAGIAAIWWLALPRHEICTAIYPAPAGCGDHRLGMAALWTGLVLVVLIVGLILARRAKGPWAAPVVLLITAATAVWAYLSVKYA